MYLGSVSSLFKFGSGLLFLQSNEKADKNINIRILKKQNDIDCA
ncbi:hypothetical protein LEP1GSC127_1196 [Leptospira kirschneri str. 200801925]|nr:hypothetical protein LEP1GSC127_1196 [Leptospira kirschneri str. 200801925]